MNEEWRAIDGCDGAYEVSDMGRVRNSRTGRILKPVIVLGYERVRVGPRGTIHARQPGRMIHHLVMETFVGPRSEGMFCRHLNDIRNDNRLVNLAYGTPSENSFDAVANGRNQNALKTHCPHGHAYSGDNLIIRKGGKRGCRTCSNAASDQCHAHDRAAAGAAVRNADKTECSKGHSLADAYVLGSGRRKCRQCTQLRAQRKREDVQK